MSDSIKKYSIDIGIIRCISMVMIVICHIATGVGNSAIGQVFQVGVQVFLFISGFLYGSKPINDVKVWIKNRILKICIPCYVFIIILVSVELVLKMKVSFWTLLLYLFNLQGVRQIYPNATVALIVGAEHLWFISVIILCYIMYVVIDKCKFLRKTMKEHPVVLLSLFFITCIFIGMFGIRIDFFWVFLCGAALSGREISRARLKYIGLSIMMVITVLLRLVMKQYCDDNGDTVFYLFVVIPTAYNCLAIWIFYTIKLIVNMFINLNQRLFSFCI